jgi:hypothetical protein
MEDHVVGVTDLPDPGDLLQVITASATAVTSVFQAHHSGDRPVHVIRIDIGLNLGGGDPATVPVKQPDGGSRVKSNAAPLIDVDM